MVIKFGGWFNPTDGPSDKAVFGASTVLFLSSVHFPHQFMQQLISELGSFISLLNHAFSPTGLLRRRSTQSWKDPQPSHEEQLRSSTFNTTALAMI